MDKQLDTFNAETKKEDILRVFESWLKESQSYHDHLLRFQNVAREYYVGNQTDRDLIPSHNTNTVENRIFEAVETIVPVATSRPHHFLVLPATDTETSVSRANLTQKVLTRKYETLEMQRKLEEITRFMLLMRFGVAKWEWSYEKDDVDVRVIDPRYMLIPKLPLDPHDLPYKIEIQEYTRSEMEEFWPKVDLDKEGYGMEEAIDVGKTAVSSPQKKFRVYEIWVNGDTVAWICSKQVLEIRETPYFDFKGRIEKYLKSDAKWGPRIAKRLVFDNIFDRPTDPYVFFTMYRTGEEPIGSTSLVEIGIPIQDAINVQKRQIIDNLRRMGNGQVYLDSDAMSQEEAENITNEVGLVLRGEFIASQNKIKREPGVPLPNAHFSNLQHSESAFDNLMGVHAATRGAGQSKTLGQDIISRQQDFTRIDLITRVLNRGVARLAMGLVQLMKMFFTETQTIKILGEEGSVEFARLNRNDIEKQIEIEVKSGETLPMDKVSLRTEAVQLWQLGALDPVTLFKRLEFPNPEKAAEMLLAWKQGQLTQETQAKIAEIAASAQFGAEAKAATEVSTPTGETGRAVETPRNVLQRATANVGGTAPSLPGIPKL